MVVTWLERSSSAFLPSASFTALTNYELYFLVKIACFGVVNSFQWRSEPRFQILHGEDRVLVFTVFNYSTQEAQIIGAVPSLMNAMVMRVVSDFELCQVLAGRVALSVGRTSHYIHRQS